MDKCSVMFHCLWHSSNSLAPCVSFSHCIWNRSETQGWGRLLDKTSDTRKFAKMSLVFWCCWGGPGNSLTLSRLSAFLGRNQHRLDWVAISSPLSFPAFHLFGLGRHPLHTSTETGVRVVRVGGVNNSRAMSLHPPGKPCVHQLLREIRNQVSTQREMSSLVRPYPLGYLIKDQ